MVLSCELDGGGTLTGLLHTGRMGERGVVQQLPYQLLICAMWLLVSLLVLGGAGGLWEGSRSMAGHFVASVAIVASAVCLIFGMLCLRRRVVLEGDTLRVVGALRSQRIRWVEVASIDEVRTPWRYGRLRLRRLNGDNQWLPGFAETDLDDFVSWQSFPKAVESLQDARDRAWRAAGLSVAGRPFDVWYRTGYGWTHDEAVVAGDAIIFRGGRNRIAQIDVLGTDRVDGHRCTILSIEYPSRRSEQLAVRLPRAVRDIDAAVSGHT